MPVGCSAPTNLSLGKRSTAATVADEILLIDASSGANVGPICLAFHMSMKKWMWSLVAVVALSSCASPSSTQPGEVDAASTANLAFFGFAAVDCRWDDPTDSEQIDEYVLEVAAFSNIAQLCVFDGGVSLAERLAVFEGAGLKAFLSVQTILFDQIADSSSPTGVRISLAPDADRRWADFLELADDLLTLDLVASIYLVDEPLWNGLSNEDFARAVGIVAATTDVPVSAVIAYPMVESVVVPEAIDWIGFDRYGVLNPGDDADWIRDLDTIGAARSRVDQRIIIVAETQWLPSYEDYGVLPADMAQVALNYLAVAESTADVVGMIGYLWPGGLDHPHQLGARSLPDSVQEAFVEIGAAVGR